MVLGGKKESLSRTGVSDVLAKIDPEYKKHLTVVLNKAQARLNHYLGLAVVSSDAILGYRVKEKEKEKKQDDYFLTNNLHSDKLQRILDKANESSAAWLGFMCVIFFNIYTSAGKKAAVEDLLVAVRKVDKRFPATLNAKKREGDESLPVPELEEDFVGLLGRMKKEHYIVVYKNENAAPGERVDINDPGKVVYALGPRYFLEIGNKSLMLKYYAFMHPGVEADKAVMKEIEEERQKELEESTNEETEA
eukprot:gene31295-38666_t